VLLSAAILLYADNMATGYEDYFVYMYINNPLALQRCQAHVVALMEQQGVRTGADWVTFDPSTLEAAIAQARKDFQLLMGLVNGVGQPRAIVTRRLDPGPTVGWGSTT
jgi:hypothetical protein